MPDSPPVPASPEPHPAPAGAPSDPLMEAVVYAAAATVVLSVIPYGGYLLYPFEYLTALIHEVGHALAVLATGGTVESMRVQWDGGGLTRSIGGWPAAVAAAGYVTTGLVGLAVFWSGRRARYASAALVGAGVTTLGLTALMTRLGDEWAPLLAVGLGIVLLLVGRHYDRTGRDGGKATFFGVASMAAAAIYLTLSGGGAAWAVGLGVGFLWMGAGAVASAPLLRWLVALLGSNLCLDGLSSLQNLAFPAMAFPVRGHSDAAGLARNLGLPTTVWAVVWALFGFGLVALAVWWLGRGRRA